MLGWGVVEGRLLLQGAAGGPTGAVHQAPVGTQGAAGQLTPTAEGGWGRNGRAQRLSGVSWSDGAKR